MWQDVKLSLSPERLCDFRTTTSSLWDSDCSEDLSSFGIMLTLRQGQRLLQQKGRCGGVGHGVCTPLGPQHRA